MEKSSIYLCNERISFSTKNNYSQVFWEIAALRIFGKFHGKHSLQASVFVKLKTPNRLRLQMPFYKFLRTAVFLIATMFFTFYSLHQWMLELRIANKDCEWGNLYTGRSVIKPQEHCLKKAYLLYSYLQKKLYKALLEHLKNGRQIKNLKG